jgi:hypothetical protein
MQINKYCVDNAVICTEQYSKDHAYYRDTEYGGQKKDNPKARTSPNPVVDKESQYNSQGHFYYKFYEGQIEGIDHCQPEIGISGKGADKVIKANINTIAVTAVIKPSPAENPDYGINGKYQKTDKHGRQHEYFQITSASQTFMLVK